VIFITAGNDRRRFRRLEEIAERVANQSRDSEIIFQHGHSHPCKRRRIVNKAFLSQEDFISTLKRANIVVTHGGAGTLLACAEIGIKPYVLERKMSLREHINDHQQEIVTAFVDKNLAVRLDEEFSTLAEQEPIDIKQEPRPLVRNLTELIWRYLR